MARDFPGDSALVLDASVIINLNATKLAAEILRTVSSRVEVTSEVCDELERGSQSKYDDANQLQVLLDQGSVARVHLAPLCLPIYHDLVAGTASVTLDDGEASTVAHAVVHNAVAVIDERKATKLCAHRFQSTRIMPTVELLLQETVEKALGPDRHAQAVFLALHNARMYVPPDFVDTVVSLIGPERAAVCSSLPRHARISR